MRLRQLHIDDYGLFSNRPLTFRLTGLQLIYGPNGAGKTTLLSLVRDLLFGIPQRSPYAYRNVKEIAATATIEMSDGRRLRFRRRKGRKDVVAGEFLETGEHVDEDVLNRLLDGASTELYRHLFAFSQQELAEGTDSLQQARPDEVLFGMGLSSLAAFRRMQQSIADQQKALFNPRGRKQIINGLLEQIRGKEQQLQEISFPPQEYARRQGEIDELEVQLEQLQTELAGLDEQRGALSRTADALPLIRRNLELSTQLNDVDAQARSVTSEQLAEYDRLSEQCGKLERDIAQVRRQSLDTDPPLTEAEQQQLAHAAQVHSLYRKIESVRQWQADLKSRRQEFEEVQQRQQHLQRMLSIKESLPALPPAEQIEAEAGDQARQFADRRQQIEQICRQSRSLQERISEVTRRQSELEDTPPDETLGELLQESGRYQRDRERVTELTRQRKALEGDDCRLQQQLGQLAPAVSLPVDPEVIPETDAVEQLAADWREAQQEVAQVQQAIDGLRQQLSDAAFDPDQEAASDDASALVALRLRRQTGWQLVRRRYVEGEQSPQLAKQIDEWTDGSPGDLIDLYEAIVTECDSAADRARVMAGDLARASERAAQYQRLQLRLDETSRELAEATTRRDQRRAAFDGLWIRADVAAGDPEQMVDWLHVYRAWEKTQAGLRKLDEELTGSGERIATYEAQLRTALDGAETIDADACPDELLRLAEDRYKSTLALHTEGQLLARDKEQLQQDLSEHKAELVEIEQLQQTSLCRLRELTRQWGCHLLPTEESGSESLDVDLPALIESLCALSSAQAKSRSLRKQIHQSSDQIEEWNRSVCGLRDFADLGADESSPLEVIEALHKTVTFLEQRQRKLEAARQARAEATKWLEDWQQQLVGTQAELNRVREALGLADSDADPKVESAELSRLRERVARSAELAGIERRLQDILPDGAASPLLREFADDQKALQTRQHQIDQQRQSLQKKLHEVSEKLGVARDGLARLADEDRTTQIASQQQSLLAQLAGEVDRWASLVVAERLLQRAQQRFEKNHQPAVLQHSGRLLERMTGGAYVAVHRELGSKPGQTRLVVETSSGTRLAPEALSRGEHQQLYLALRLALVEEYCRQSEPLPIVMDDVLVDFDDDRALRTLGLLSEFAADRQVLFLTCHERMVRMLETIDPDITAMEIEPGSLSKLRSMPAVDRQSRGPASAGKPSRPVRRQPRPQTAPAEPTSQPVLFPEAR